MVSTVITQENHLLSDEEIALLTVFAHLSCTSIHLIFRPNVLTWDKITHGFLW